MPSALLFPLLTSSPGDAFAALLSVCWTMTLRQALNMLKSAQVHVGDGGGRAGRRGHRAAALPAGDRAHGARMAAGAAGAAGSGRPHDLDVPPGEGSAGCSLCLTSAQSGIQ